MDMAGHYSESHADTDVRPKNAVCWSSEAYLLESERIVQHLDQAIGLRSDQALLGRMCSNACIYYSMYFEH